MKDEAEGRVTSVRINVEMERVKDFQMNNLKQTLLSYRGSVPIHLVFEHKDGRARMPLGEDFLVNPSPQLAAKVNEIFDSNAVKFIVDGRVEDAVSN